MTFKTFSREVHARYTAMAKEDLFIADVDEIFEHYLLAFPAGTDPIHKTRSVHDCNCCKQFIRRLGTLVTADGRSAWDNMENMPEPYATVARRLSDLVRQAPIKTVFRTKEKGYGADHNYGPDNTRYDHYVGSTGAKHYSLTPETARGEREAIFQVLKRGLTELNPGDLDTVADVITAGALYRGQEHFTAVSEFRKLQRDYLKNPSDRFIWANLDNRAARFRNTAIGTLLVDLAAGVPLEDAVRMFESKVAPQNYKRTTALVTPKMVEEAQAKLIELGLESAIHRRHATIRDVSVNDVLFVDNTVRANMKDGGIADIIGTTGIKHSTPDPAKATPITIDDFMNTIMCKTKSLAVLVENKHTGNFVSLTGADGPERPFKWDNNFAWSYDGEVTDSIKQRVKQAGGNINALMRVSLSWFNTDDLDLHCISPEHGHISFMNKAGTATYNTRAVNILDVDMNVSGESSTPVENLAFQKLRDGIYKVQVHQYTKRNSTDVGFTLEVECAGVVQQFHYQRAVANKHMVDAIHIHVKDNKIAKIDVPLPTLVTSGTSSQEKWGVKTNTLVPVSTLMNSPNHWGSNSIGNKHWFFMLKDCINPEPIRGIYNEFLRGDLDKHRKVFEILGAKTKCPPTDNQLSGLGFSSGRDDTVTVVVNGQRPYNVRF